MGKKEEPPVSAQAAYEFSAPVIKVLEKGKYYLQLRAYTRADLAQSELARLGNTYPLAVQPGGNPDRPFYRILIGPMNLGESNALLRRFRGNGYQDAFIRQSE
jgi:cell division septation protein DedD